MPERLAGRVCIITGTGGSVGRAAAALFAREGASVVGCDVNVAAAQATVDLVVGEGGTMQSLQPCDLTSSAVHGVVVNMASLNATLSFKPLPSLAHTTAKAGIIGMTRQSARSAGGDRQRRAVPHLGRELLHHRHRRRG